MTSLDTKTVLRCTVPVRDPGYVQTYGIMCCTCGPLVYVRNLKCASAFFWRNLLNKKWQEINWLDIDWDRQHVFGHILEPMERRHKGLAEYVNNTETSGLFLQNIQFQKFVTSAPLMEAHVASYFDTFGSLANNVDWIPISGLDHQAVIELTERLLFNWGIRTLGNWDYQWTHRSDPAKKSIETRIAELYASEPTAPWMDHYYAWDKDLYSRVAANFNPRPANSWSQVSWLNK